MKWLIRVALIIVAGALLAYYYPADPGEIFVRMPGVLPPFKTVPIVFICGLVLALILIFYAFKFIAWFLCLPWSFSDSWHNYRKVRSEEKLLTGWVWFASGGNIEALNIAEKTYKTAYLKNDSALLATLANLKMDKTTEAEEWLNKVVNPKSRQILLNGITKIQLLLRKNEAENALKEISEIENQSGINSVVGRMKVEAYEKLANWEDMVKVSNTLYKKKWVTTKEYIDWITKARMGEILSMEKNAESNPYKWWKKLTDDEKYSDTVLDSLVNLLILRKDFASASEVIEKTIDFKIKNKLPLPEKIIYHYGEIIENVDIEKSLNKCQDWLLAEKENPALLRICGRLSERASLWGNAINYYEASLAFETDKTTIKSLAKIYEQTGNNDKADKIIQKLLTLE